MDLRMHGAIVMRHVPGRSRTVCSDVTSIARIDAEDVEPITAADIDTTVARMKEADTTAGVAGRASALTDLNQNPRWLAAIQLLTAKQIAKGENAKRKKYKDAVRDYTTNSNNCFTASQLLPLVFTSGGTTSATTANFLSRIITKTFETQALNFNRDPVASYAVNNEKAVLSHWLYQDLSIVLAKNMFTFFGQPLQ